MNGKIILVGAASGLLAAALTDVQAWAATEGNFNWAIALKRWLFGALSGAAASFGIPGATL
ncbi:MAG: hypothetical protein KF812_02280 [Fimbriimonadaceae bacterium]|nr:hypothetical protein [Fimbriimonadaceae bacterium]